MPDTEKIRAHHNRVKKHGHWTTARRFDVVASSGTVVLELRSPQIEPGDIEIRLDIDHSVVKLLVPDGAIVDHDDLRRVGKSRVKDWTGTPLVGGRRIVLDGEMRHAEVRVHRGGIAILSAIASRDFVTDARQARREGRFTTVDDPSR